MTTQATLQRFLLWIDGVGGYLVCSGAQTTFGQAVPGNAVDVPLVADVARHQLTIHRDAEGYVVEPRGPALVAGRPISSPTTLADGDRLTFGPVELRFRRPHALSATARIELTSAHRVRPLCDAILLLGETCILGPRETGHVVCRDWPCEVTLVRRGQGLVCQMTGSFEIDGRRACHRGPLGQNSLVRGSGFSFALEPLG